MWNYNNNNKRVKTQTRVSYRNVPHAVSNTIHGESYNMSPILFIFYCLVTSFIVVSNFSTVPQHDIWRSCFDYRRKKISVRKNYE